MITSRFPEMTKPDDQISDPIGLLYLSLIRSFERQIRGKHARYHDFWRATFGPGKTWAPALRLQGKRDLSFVAAYETACSLVHVNVATG